MIRNSIHNLFAIVCLLTLVLAVGCVRSNVDTDFDSVPEGQPANCFIQLQDLGLTPVSRGMELTDDQERFIKSLFIFVFDKNGKLLSSTEHIDVTLHGSGTTWDPVGIHAVTGNNRTIYAVANYNSQVVENVKSVASLDDLKNLVVQNLGSPLSHDQGLIKVGSLENVNIRNGNVYPVPLTNLVSKITIKVVNKCLDLDVTGWTIDGFALKSYVVERPFNPDNLNYNDASDIYDPSDFYNSFSNQSFAFPKVEEVDPANKTYSVTGYCYENRRGGRIQRESPPVGWPNGNESSGTRTEVQLKSWYAPTNATRVRIHGRDQSTERILTINHYLGNNNTNDYSIHRGKHYTYTITINSLNNIDIDTNIAQSNTKIKVKSSPDLNALDAHGTMRMFQVLTDELSANSGTVDFEVLANMSTETERPSWLKVAGFPLVTYQVKATAADPNISTWQQDGVPENFYATTKFIPHKSVRANLSSYTPPTGIQLGTADYPDDDDVLPFDKAIHRMCYKITDLPLATAKPTPMFIYADEYEYDPSPIAPDYREAIVRVTFAPTGGIAQHAYFTVRQYRPTLFRGLPGETTAMLLERNEEFHGLIQTSIPLELQTLGGIQWGPVVAGEPDLALSSKDGYLNTLQAVFKNVNSSSSWDASYGNERTKYGSNAGEWEGVNGAIQQPVTNTNLSGRPFFLYNLDGKDYYNKFYNTTAARYCHAKNFDKNGDGTISPEETVWYLPSEQELQMMWTYNEVLKLSPVFYWSSTLPTTGSDNAIAISMRRSMADVGTAHNGVPQERPRSGYKIAGKVIDPPRVRCVRRINTAALFSPIVTRSIDGNAVIDCSSLPGDLYTTTSKMGLSQKSIGELQNANNNIYKRFEVQSNQPASATYQELYHGVGKCDERAGWRMPTQRELLLIWSVKDKLSALNGFTAFANDSYWTMLRSNTQNYLVDFDTGLAGCHEPQTHSHHYRCIREL